MNNVEPNGTVPSCEEYQPFFIIMASKKINVIDVNGGHNTEILGNEEGYKNLLADHGVTYLRNDSNANIRDFASLEHGGTYTLGPPQLQVRISSFCLFFVPTIKTHL